MCTTRYSSCHLLRLVLLPPERLQHFCQDLRQRPTAQSFFASAITFTHTLRTRATCPCRLPPVPCTVHLRSPPTLPWETGSG